jgi:DNA-binding NarL/FixJ family response regulator
VGIRIVLAEDNYLVREGVTRLLATEPELELVAVCEDFDSLLAAIESEKPDVLLTSRSGSSASMARTPSRTITLSSARNTLMRPSAIGQSPLIA